MILYKMNANEKSVVLNDCLLATGFLDRLIGYMGKKQVASSEGILFPDCSSVHMWFMRTNLDVLFLKSESKNTWKVTTVYSNVPAWKILPLASLSSDTVLEIQPGNAGKLQIQEGDRLCID